MFRTLTVFTVVVFLPVFGLADDQKLPPTIKAGADFIWHVAHSNTVNEALDLDDTKVSVKLGPKSLKVLEKMLVDLKKIRAELEPNVSACKQEFFNREMNVVYVLSSTENVQKYYRLHIIEVATPPTISGIEELTWRDIVGGKCLQIEQVVPEP